MNHWFELGFMNKCAECGIDPYSAGVLYKSAVLASPPHANAQAQPATQNVGYSNAGGTWMNRMTGDIRDDEMDRAIANASGSFAKPQPAAPAQPTAPVPSPATAPATAKPTAQPATATATATARPKAPAAAPATAPATARPKAPAEGRPYAKNYNNVSPTAQAMIRGLWNEQNQYARQTEEENAMKRQQEQFRAGFSAMDAAGQYDALMKMAPEQRREYARTLSPYRQQQIMAVQAQRKGQQAQPGQIGGWTKADQWAAMSAKDKYNTMQKATPEQRALLRKYTSQNDYDEIMRLHRQKKYNDSLYRGDFDTARSITW